MKNTFKFTSVNYRQNSMTTIVMRWWEFTVG